MSETEDTKLPVDDATVVHEDAEEKGNDDLVADVAKLLEDTPGEEPETPVQAEEPAEEAEETVEPMGEDLQSRVKDAGMTEEFAQQLHESGQLEQALAAMDRRMIDYVQSKEEPEGEKEKPSSEEAPELDPELYDEGIIARDAAQTKRIEALEAMVEELAGGQRNGFDQWFDGAIEKLGVNPSDSEKCQTVFKAYEAVCAAFGADPNARDPDMVQRAYAAMYPQDVFKKQVERLRDTSGKFVSSPASRGGPPPKDATPEEVDEHLVSQVGSYLKEQGVQMSGY